jgi:hypothetical protein
MSNLAYTAPIRAPRETEIGAANPRRIRIVTTRAQRRARPKLVYALGATVVIFAIFLAQLLITIALSSGAYRIDGLQSSQQDLGRTASALNERLNTLGSSQNLQANAVALGMVGSARAAFLRLSDGAVLGSSAPAHGSTSTASVLSGADTSVPNSLLTGIPVISSSGALTVSTGTGHGDSNAVNSTSGNTESTQGQTAPTHVGATSPVSPTSPPSGDLPSPVTH